MSDTSKNETKKRAILKVTKMEPAPSILSSTYNRTARARKANNDYLNEDAPKPVIKTEVANDTAPSSAVKST
jgi:hypothetical protein